MSRFSDTLDSRLVCKCLRELEKGTLTAFLRSLQPTPLSIADVWSGADAPVFTQFLSDAARASVKLFDILGRGETTSSGTITVYWAGSSSSFVTGLPATNSIWSPSWNWTVERLAPFIS